MNALLSSRSTQMVIMVLVITGGFWMYSAWSQGNNSNMPGVTATAFKDISATIARQMLDSNTLLLDVRTQGEYDSRHLPEAILIPLQSLKARQGELTPYKNKPIIIYCRTGRRSSIAASYLAAQGFTNIYNLQGGLNTW